MRSVLPLVKSCEGVGLINSDVIAGDIDNLLQSRRVQERTLVAIAPWLIRIRPSIILLRGWHILLESPLRATFPFIALVLRDMCLGNCSG